MTPAIAVNKNSIIFLFIFLITIFYGERSRAATVQRETVQTAAQNAGFATQAECVRSYADNHCDQFKQDLEEKDRWAVINCANISGSTDSVATSEIDTQNDRIGGCLYGGIVGIPVDLFYAGKEAVHVVIDRYHEAGERAGKKCNDRAEIERILAPVRSYVSDEALTLLEDCQRTLEDAKLLLFHQEKILDELIPKRLQEEVNQIRVERETNGVFLSEAEVLKLARKKLSRRDLDYLGIINQRDEKLRANNSNLPSSTDYTIDQVRKMDPREALASATEFIKKTYGVKRAEFLQKRACLSPEGAWSFICQNVMLARVIYAQLAKKLAKKAAGSAAESIANRKGPGKLIDGQLTQPIEIKRDTTGILYKYQDGSRIWASRPLVNRGRFHVPSTTEKTASDFTDRIARTVAKGQLEDKDLMKLANAISTLGLDAKDTERLLDRITAANLNAQLLKAIHDSPDAETLKLAIRRLANALDGPIIAEASAGPKVASQILGDAAAKQTGSISSEFSGTSGPLSEMKVSEVAAHYSGDVEKTRAELVSRRGITKAEKSALISRFDQVLDQARANERIFSELKASMDPATYQKIRFLAAEDQIDGVLKETDLKELVRRLSQCSR